MNPELIAGDYQAFTYMIMGIGVILCVGAMVAGWIAHREGPEEIKKHIGMDENELD